MVRKEFRPIAGPLCTSSLHNSMYILAWGCLPNKEEYGAGCDPHCERTVDPLVEKAAYFEHETILSRVHMTERVQRLSFVAESIYDMERDSKKEGRGLH